MSIISRLDSKTAVVSVVGLGYVGLPLALTYARAGIKTIGVDIDSSKTDTISRGLSYINHIDSDEIKRAVSSGNLIATTDFSQLSSADGIILCVPTPLARHFEPDLSCVVDSIKAILPFVRQGQIISLESTTYPGTTDAELVSRLTESGFEVGKDIFVVYSPEREDPGNEKYSASNIPKIVGGATSECLEQGKALYGAVFDRVVPVSSTRVAELAKLLENIYRSVNIGLVNEMKIVANRMGIDIWEVIAAASTKPFGFSAFYPGPGLGGHCIPIDPFYLTWKAKEYGVHTRFIELAGEINTSMPQYVVSKLVEAMNNHCKSVRGSKILILGLAYKADVDDDRESPTCVLMEMLHDLGADVDYYDRFVPVMRPTRQHAKLAGKKSIEWCPNRLEQYDASLIATAHSNVDYRQLVELSKIVVDTRNACASIISEKIVKA
ncbi:MAG: nucleotide sugar dehydrogenase [Pirellula sp.]